MTAKQKDWWNKGLVSGAILLVGGWFVTTAWTTYERADSAYEQVMLLQNDKKDVMQRLDNTVTLSDFKELKQDIRETRKEVNEIYKCLIESRNNEKSSVKSSK